jgi:hypothetical protein
MPHNRAFVPLFSQILDSSIWSEPHATVRVWITLLAAASGPDHLAKFSSSRSLAHRARVTIAECENALRVLEQPDPYSTIAAYAGQRIQRVHGGWIILNGDFYDRLAFGSVGGTAV